MEIVSPSIQELEASPVSLLGIGAIAAELAAQGISVSELFRGTGLSAEQMEDPSARMSHHQRLVLYRNAKRLSRRPEIGLLAGTRQRISDYGIYGYALVTSATLRDAFELGLRHLSLAGPTLQVRYRVEKGSAILSSHGMGSLGDLLPFALEFWRSSISTLYGRVLEAPVPTKRMLFDYPAPAYWRSYERIFNCPVEFDAGLMEWHLDESALDMPCPNASPITAKMCQQLCEKMVQERGRETSLVRRIKTECVNSPQANVGAAEMARRLELSDRTLFRRLAEEHTTYQKIVDEVRTTLAQEYLAQTSLTVEEIAARLGFSEPSNFRRAFKKWVGVAPVDFRHARHADAQRAR